MKCRTCGTEIADKAIVCFRCGAATTDPVRKAPTLAPRRGPFLPVLVAAVLGLLALYLGQASRTAADPTRWQLGAGLLVLVAAAVLIARMVRRH